MFMATPSANDLTRRIFKQPKSGLPWDMAKGFDNSAVIGTVHPWQRSDIQPQVR
jgi:2-keto-4-pentenoate hydratase/2-oxohepta-3-ene-1,7-dioic acid hydratase in catechol pathway